MSREAAPAVVLALPRAAFEIPPEPVFVPPPFQAAGVGVWRALHRLARSRTPSACTTGVSPVRSGGGSGHRYVGWKPPCGAPAWWSSLQAGGVSAAGEPGGARQTPPQDGPARRRWYMQASLPGEPHLLGAIFTEEACLPIKPGVYSTHAQSSVSTQAQRVARVEEGSHGPLCLLPGRARTGRAPLPRLRARTTGQARQRPHRPSQRTDPPAVSWLRSACSARRTLGTGHQQGT